MDNMRKITVTVGIPAHNEERNIKTLLQSLANQVENTCTIESIVVMCDGCTDNTAEIAKNSFSGSGIKVIDDGERVGKIERMNRLFRSTETDILIIFDADIQICDSDIIEKIVAKFQSENVGLVAGLQVPAEPRNFSESVFATMESIWIETRKDINNGVSVHNIAGCNFAMSKKFYSNLVIPKEIIADDEFLFFESRRMGFEFVFTPDVVVSYHLPDNFHDYFMQSTRFMTTKYKIFEHFDESLEEYYHVPSQKKIKALSKFIFKKPITTVLSVFLHLFMKVFVRHYKVLYFNNVYEQARSTK